MKIRRVKNGKNKDFLEWGEELMSSRSLEAKKSLQEENCSRELFYMFKIGDDWYAVGHMEGDNLLPASDCELNRKHKKVLKECLEETVELTKVYDLTADL